MSDQLTMRDTFAAAALNGWLASQQTVINQYTMARKAYEYADAMLLERERTNHDAAPAARGDDRECAAHVTTGGTLDRDVEPATTAHSSGNDGIRPDSHGTGDTHEPVAWYGRAARSDGGSVVCIRCSEEEVARELFSGDTCDPRELFPLYRHPEPTDIVPKPSNNAQPVAWAVMEGDWYHCSFLARNVAEEFAGKMNEISNRLWSVVSLYRNQQLTVTDAESLARLFHDEYERRAREFGYETRPDTRQFDASSPNGRLMIAVCRTVLERLGGVA